MKRVIVPLAPGFEEIEAVVIIDILRRGGIEVVVAGLSADSITGSHDITVACDARLEILDPAAFDAVVLPGGMPGALRLRESPAVRDAVVKLASSGRLVAAVCAAPTVLAACGVLDGLRATSHPAHAHEMEGCRYVEAAVVEDGNVITSRGAGTTMAFAAAIVARLAGEETAREILARIQYAAPAP